MDSRPCWAIAAAVLLSLWAGSKHASPNESAPSNVVGRRHVATTATVLGEPQMTPGDPMRAKRLDCGADRFEFVTTSRLLPDGMLVVLGAGKAIADRGEDFNSTDLITRELPSRRFAAAAIGRSRIFAVVEHGGIGYNVETWAFERKEGQWIGNRRWIGVWPPESLPELLSVTCDRYPHVRHPEPIIKPIYCVTFEDDVIELSFIRKDEVGLMYQMNLSPASRGTPRYEQITEAAGGRVLPADERRALLTKLQGVRTALGSNDSCAPAVDAYLQVLGEASSSH